LPGQDKLGGKMDVQALIIWLIVGAVAAGVVAEDTK
jgi:hypothetical protein